MSRDRCSPDVHWAFEHLSFLPYPQAPHVAGPTHGLPRADRGQQQHGSHRDSPSQGAPHHGPAAGMSLLSPCPGESPGPPRSQYGSSGSPPGSHVLLLSQRPGTIHGLPHVPGSVLVREFSLKHKVYLSLLGGLCKTVVSKLSACDSCSGLVCPFPSALPGHEPSRVTICSLGTADLTWLRNSTAKLQ